ncbi:FecCD family ABC transporter permease [Nocardia aurantia]|uniref:Ferric enterobactin transport system permease protein FepG n=1 Tax=Nocardia aurantia TaxID=2585199 RepID=A0A7K0DKE9_9NOCA|nr:iron chelate uptake ABC transporter family permease subunit [Nocardia aurantia]MQY26275.1 Ferric enterobactin transport system permease protein FepG [Nocardia aurantia]
MTADVDAARVSGEAGPLARVRPAIRIGRFSAVRRIPVLLTVIALAVAVFVLFAIDISVGAYAIPLGRVLDVLGGAGTRAQRFVILESRLPRAVTAVVAGAGLGLAGAVSQSILRNPLASPDVLGIGTGASFAAVAVIGTAGTGFAGTAGVPLAALAGGLVTAAVIYLLAWRRDGAGSGGASGIRLVLIGIGVNTMLTAGVSWLLTLKSQTDAARSTLWLTGSLDGADWSRAVPAAIGLAVVLVGAAASARTLAALRFGDETVRALGVRVQTAQAGLVGTAVIAAALATAAVGPLTFVGLAAPQIARRLLRLPGEPVLGSALCGALIVLAADIAARTVLPVDLPAGIVTAACGAPLLLFLLVRINRKAARS